jgi:hypothetical protein
MGRVEGVGGCSCEVVIDFMWLLDCVRIVVVCV